LLLFSRHSLASLEEDLLIDLQQGLPVLGLEEGQHMGDMWDLLDLLRGFALHLAVLQLVTLVGHRAC
jgi:hypothetical protein